MEETIKHILRGTTPSHDPALFLCDFTLAEQNAAAEAQGVVPSVPSSFVPKLGDNLTYIVACVIINQHGQVLMMQEAKSSCAGKWYLPAGRVERGETFIQAGIRETKEETGIVCEPTTLLAVECAGGSWFRFTLAAEAISGELKTPARADEDSLQAMWIGDLGEIVLRSDDVIHLVERARSRISAQKSRTYWHSDGLPRVLSHRRNTLRLMAVIKKRSNNKVHVLVGEKTQLHLPSSEIHPTKSVHSTLRKFLIEIFGAELPQHRPHGILSVEHCPSDGEDGVCLTLLVAFRPPLEEAPIIGKFVWQEVSDQLGESLLDRVASKNATYLMHVVR